MANLKKEHVNKIGWTVIFAIIALNFFLLYKLKSNSLDVPPFNDLDIDGPTLIVVVDEFECVDCINNLMFLDDMYIQLKDEGRINFLGIILSREKTDRKKIAKAFRFPFIVSDDFKILKRLNMNRTPLLIGISEDKRIVYCELIPVSTALDDDYIRRGLLDRLYYSLSWD